MIKNLFFLLIFLSLFSCHKKEIATKNQSKISDTLVITEKCVVFSSPTIQQIEKLKKEMGEEDFYIAADDYNYYDYEASEFLKKKNIKTINDTTRFLKFMSKKGNIIIDRDTTSGWQNYLFEPNQKPVKSFSIDIESDFKKYFEK